MFQFLTLQIFIFQNSEQNELNKVADRNYLATERLLGNKIME